MDTHRRRIVGPALVLVAAAALIWSPSRARAQFPGYGYGGYGVGGYGGFGGYGGYGGYGYPMGGYGYGGFGYGYPGYAGYGFGGFGYGYGNPGFGYGYPTVGYPVGLPAPMYGYYGGGYGFGYGGPGAFNPLFGVGMTPLGLQSYLAERYVLGRGLTGYARPAAEAPAATNITVRP